jgi:hypothetical protein
VLLICARAQGLCPGTPDFLPISARADDEIKQSLSFALLIPSLYIFRAF